MRLAARFGPTLLGIVLFLTGCTPVAAGPDPGGAATAVRDLTEFLTDLTREAVAAAVL